MNEQKMVTTKYCIDIRTKSITCRQTENGYYEVFINTSIPKAKQSREQKWLQRRVLYVHTKNKA
jgi:hypothetical protein